MAASWTRIAAGRAFGRRAIGRVCFRGVLRVAGTSDGHNENARERRESHWGNGSMPSMRRRETILGAAREAFVRITGRRSPANAGDDLSRARGGAARASAEDSVFAREIRTDGWARRDGVRRVKRRVMPRRKLR